MRTSLIVSVALLIATACGSKGDKSGNDSANSAAPSGTARAGGASAVATTLPKPCDLVTVAELNAGLIGEAMTQKDRTQPGGSVASCDWLGSGASSTNGNIRIESGGQAGYEKIKSMTAPASIMGPLEDLAGIGTLAFAGYKSTSGIGMAQVTYLASDRIVTVIVGAEESVHSAATLRSISKSLATTAAGRMK
jgi:hypothetical protein